ncbi:D-alanine--D-alanine ligase [Flavobacterium sp. NG2]|uniref:D-alanine--D-alanine ligase n=1 Tax=Flavobacterium sp. NG2 TaxID=3097547 RepID=UPI002A83C696|nr:D-alanine--D-alanine ligase [Flavobacterium sp. NG2]WPR72664.1 D-alanine--D-alanine ligase [Flavobacterium sp. NG2]
MNWEYWPYQLVYVPIYFLWFFYAIKSKSIFFFSASNPSIKNGGFVMESKKAIYDLIPQKFYPKTELIKEGSSIDEIKKRVDEAQIQFPFIAKPDIGLRGSAVKKINTIADLNQYAQKANFDFIVQDLIPYENEIGVFYVRYPNQKKGKITGIVSKEFLVVTGNGAATIEELILENPRYALQFTVLKKEYGLGLNKVLPEGEKMNLVPYGNHARGAKFIDGSHWVTPALEKMIDEMCQQIPEFYFGRLDIMYQSLEELELGNNFLIVELNGAASEPTHIYDPRHSLFFAWKELARHITYMYEISVENNKRGATFLPHKLGVQELKSHWEQSAKIVNF